jgi:hypothetical protein
VARAVVAAFEFRAADEHGRPYPPDAEFHRRYAAAEPAPILDEVCGLGRGEDAGATGAAAAAAAEAQITAEVRRRILAAWKERYG